MTIVAPADADEMRRLMPQTLDYPGPIYIRLGKGYDPIVTTDDVPFVIGKVLPMRQGNDALILTTGITLKIALDAAEALSESGISASVIHVPTVKPLDVENILSACDKVPVVVTIEEHVVIGGLGTAVAEIIAEANFDSPKRFKRIGLPDAFPDRYGSQDSLMTHYALTAANLTATVSGLLEQQPAVHS